MIFLAFLIACAAQDDSGVRKGAWEKMVSPIAEELTAVWFATPRTGWIVSRGGAVLKSTDGGVSWKAQRAGAPAQSSNFFEHVWFQDERRGWIAQCGSTCEIMIVRVLSTTDGGETWTQKERPDLEDYLNLMKPFQFTTSKGDCWTRSHSWSVYVTPAGGKISTIASERPGLERFGGASVSSLYDVSFATKEAGMLAGGAGSKSILLRTDDAGATWTEQTVEGLKAKSLRRVSMTDASEARILPEDGASLWATRDAGKTWRAEWTGKGDEQVREFIFPARGLGIAIGQGGLILRRDAR